MAERNNASVKDVVASEDRVQLGLNRDQKIQDLHDKVEMINKQRKERNLMDKFSDNFDENN